MQHFVNLSSDLSGNITTFLVSQRSASIQQADLILVLMTVNLSGKGTHADLIRTCDTYREIYSLSFRKKERNTPLYTAVSVMMEVTYEQINNKHQQKQKHGNLLLKYSVSSENTVFC